MNIEKMCNSNIYKYVLNSLCMKMKEYQFSILGHTYFIILGLIMFLDPMSVIE
jgi:hypothetical protein